MPFAVLLTAGARHDLEDLFDFIALHDSPERAEAVLEKIESVFSALSRHPNRGAFPKELLELGIREYREVFFKPYRIVYRVKGTAVYVLLIVDGRRDMRSLLQKRLLEA